MAMDEKLTIGLTGDVMLGRTLDKVISKKGYDYPWGNLLPLMKATDINIINLETTLTHSNKKVPKTFNFKASPDKIKSLIEANITVANLANNHIFDFHTDGLLETIKTLDSAGIRHVGAGRDLNEAAAVAIIQKNDLTVGVLGITDNEPGWAAFNGPGTNYVDIDSDEDCRRILNAIAAIRNKVDIVIVSIHWGPNMRQQPTRRFVHFGHLISQHGAHIIPTTPATSWMTMRSIQYFGTIFRHFLS
jgi:poly-gamma-glutamate synthesis protein (capsule biosynthesis protein)